MALLTWRRSGGALAMAGLLAALAASPAPAQSGRPMSMGEVTRAAQAYGARDIEEDAAASYSVHGCALTHAGRRGSCQFHEAVSVELTPGVFAPGVLDSGLLVTLTHGGRLIRVRNTLLATDLLLRR